MSTKYHVVYSKMGNICKDSFETIQEATEDYKLKLEMDKQGLFDDRFVLHIEDNEGKIADVEI
jgi:hypothetical protein